MIIESGFAVVFTSCICEGVLLCFAVASVNDFTEGEVVVAGNDFATPGGSQYWLVDRYFFQFASHWMLREVVAMHGAASKPAGGAMAGR